jgi:SAM-dependent methyltransferase
MEEQLYDELRRIEDVHWWLTTRRRILLQFLRSTLAMLPSPSIVLDCGSGTGSLSRYVGAEARLVGLDVSVKGIEESNTGGRFVCASVEQLPFTSGSFDVVCAFDLLEHLDDDVEVLRNIGRILKSKGYLLVSVPAYRLLWGELDEVAHHKRRYTLRELSRKLISSDFVLERATYFNSFLFPLVLIVRLTERLRRFRSPQQSENSDFGLAGDGFVNGLLGMLFRMELPYLRHFNFVYGGSIFCVARKA